MAWSTEISQLVTETEQFIDAVELKKPTLDAAANTAVLNAATTLASAANTVVIATASTTSADVSKGHAVTTEAIANLTKMQADAVSDAERQASLAAGYALSAGTIVQQDLSGVTAAALHRSPNAITSMFIYDTSKDSDGGAWTEKCQNTSWYNEDIAGKWFGPCFSESAARAKPSTVNKPNLISNGSFDSNIVGWTSSSGSVLTWDAGRLRITNGSASYGQANVTITTVVGTMYLLSFDKIFGTVDSAVRATADGGFNWNIIPTNSGGNEYVFIATSTSTMIQFGLMNAAIGAYAWLDNIVVKEATFTAAASSDYFQLTTDGKFYRLWKNIFTWSDQFDNGAWIKTNVDWTPNAVSNPVVGAGSGAELFIPNTTSGTHGLQHGVNYSSSYIEVVAKAAGYSCISITDGGNNFTVRFDLTGTGATVIESGSPTEVSILALSDGWYRCRFRQPQTVTSAQFRIYFRPSITGSTWVNWVGDGTSGVYLAIAQQTIGSFSDTYESKTTAGPTSEVFRGNKRDFPRLAGVVVEGGAAGQNNIAVYDLTETGRPMWMAFRADSSQKLLIVPSGYILQAASMLNSEMLVGGSVELYRVNFAADRAIVYSTLAVYRAVYNGGIAQRMEVRGYTPDANIPAIANRNVNTIAMTVLPDAPTDPVTGLKVPTIAVATAGGISVIKHDGVVRNSGYTSGINRVAFIDNQYLWSTFGGYNNFTPRSTWEQASFNIFGTNAYYDTSNSFPLRELSGGDGSNKLARGEKQHVIASSKGTRLLKRHHNTTKALAADITPTYNTGWITGDIRRTYLSDTVVGSPVGGELVVNGTFDTDDAGWSGTGTRTVSEGRLNWVVNSLYQVVWQAITVVPGTRYLLSYNRVSGTGTLECRVGLSPLTNNVANASHVNTGVNFLSFTPTTSTVYIGLQANNLGTYVIDDFSIFAAVEDRSYKAVRAPINGTLTRSQLASGTSLVGYSGFSAANYLREPYSADLDFGTGEFSASAWVNIPVVLPGVGPELVTNGMFDTDTSGWTGQSGTLSWSNGVAQVVSTAQPYPGIIQTGITTIVGKRYIFSATVTSTGSGSPTYLIIVRNGTTNAEIARSVNVNVGTTPTQIVFLWTATVATIHIQVLADTPSLTGTATFDKISMLEVVGPAICERAISTGTRIRLGVTSLGQLTGDIFDGTTTRTVTTSASYNTAQWLKAEANYTTDGSLAIRVNGREVAVTRGTPLLSLNSRYNLLTHSEEFNNLTWNIPNVTLLPNQLGPGSSNNGTQITFTADGGTGIRRTGLSGLGSGLTNVLNAALKYGTWRWFEFTTVRSGVATRSWIDLQNGVAGTTNHVGFTVTPANNGWIRFSGQIGSTGIDEIYVTPRNSNGDAANAIGNNGATIFATEFDIRPLALAALPYQRVGTTVTDFNFQAPLTIGNNFAVDAPFPGSIALLKLSATVPTTEQSTFMYEQEKQLFRADAVSVLPDANSILDMSYDDATDRWSTISATNESYWTGLVRNAVTSVPAGSYSKITTTSGIELSSRITTNPGVDISIPTYSLRSDLNKRAEAASKAFKEIVNFDYIGGFTASTTAGSTAITSVANLTYPVSPVGARITGAGIPTNATIISVSGTTMYISAAATATATGVSISFLDFNLPTGFEAETVATAGAIRREGTTADFTRLFDGFIETIRFAVVPGSTTWVQIQASRIIS